MSAKDINPDSIADFENALVITPMSREHQADLNELRNKNLRILRQQIPHEPHEQLEWWHRHGAHLPAWVAEQHHIDGHRAYFHLTPRGFGLWEISYLEERGTDPHMKFAALGIMHDKMQELNGVRMFATSFAIPERAEMRHALELMGFKREGTIRASHYDIESKSWFDQITHGFVMGQDVWEDGFYQDLEEGLPF